MDNDLYIHLRQHPVSTGKKDNFELKTSLEIALEGAVNADRFFAELEQEARGARLVIEGARQRVNEAQATGQERTIGLDQIESAYRRLQLVLTGYALFKAMTGGTLTADLAEVNLTNRKIVEG